MTKAEVFKATFDRDVKPGESFGEVLRYLNAHNLHFGTYGLTSPQDDPPSDGNGPIAVELFREKSPNWYCGNGSVGLFVSFAQNRLTGTEVSFWSFDCP